MVKSNGYGRPVLESEQPERADGSLVGRPVDPLPMGFIIIVLGWTLTMLFYYNWHGIPIWLTIIAYGIPIAGVVAFSYHVSKLPHHTKHEKRKLWMFFLFSYIMGVGIYVLTMALSVEVHSETGLMGAFGNGYLIIPVPLAIILSGLVLGFHILSGDSPFKRPLPYIGLVLGTIAFVILLMPVPNNLSGDEVPDVARNEMPWDDDREFVWVQPLWYYHLTTTDIGFEGIVIQLAMAVTALIFGSIWALIRPMDFYRTFGLSSLIESEEGNENSTVSRKPLLRIIRP